MGIIKLVISKEELHNLYVTKGLSTRAIGKLYGLLSKNPVRRLLKLYDIPVREEPKAVSKRYGSIGYGIIQAYYLTRIKKHAQGLGVECKVNAEYLHNLFIKQNERCSISGIKLIFRTKPNEQQTASLDRIDGKLGYVENNVRWIHKALQKMKQNMDTESFIDWCITIAEYNKCLKFKS
jgi:hypothetical protein